jgi:hypothetical protein
VSEWKQKAFQRETNDTASCIGKSLSEGHSDRTRRCLYFLRYKQIVTKNTDVTMQLAMLLVPRCRSHHLFLLPQIRLPVFTA